MPEGAWRRVATLVRRRRGDLHKTQQDLALAAGTTDRLIRAVEKAERETIQPAVLRSISYALGWTPDSIERILAGDEPVQSGPAQPDIEQQLAEIRDRLTKLERALDHRDQRRPATAEDIERHTLAKINESLSRSSTDHPPTTDADQQSA